MKPRLRPPPGALLALRLLREERGQAIFLTVMALFIAVIGLAMVLNVGTETQRKIQLKAVADSAVVSGASVTNKADDSLGLLQSLGMVVVGTQMVYANDWYYTTALGYYLAQMDVRDSRGLGEYGRSDLLYHAGFVRRNGGLRGEAPPKGLGPERLGLDGGNMPEFQDFDLRTNLRSNDTRDNYLETLKALRTSLFLPILGAMTGGTETIQASAPAAAALAAENAAARAGMRNVLLGLYPRDFVVEYTKYDMGLSNFTVEDGIVRKHRETVRRLWPRKEWLNLGERGKRLAEKLDDFADGDDLGSSGAPNQVLQGRAAQSPPDLHRRARSESLFDVPFEEGNPSKVQGLFERVRATPKSTRDAWYYYYDEAVADQRVTLMRVIDRRGRPFAPPDEDDDDDDDDDDGPSWDWRQLGPRSTQLGAWEFAEIGDLNRTPPVDMDHVRSFGSEWGLVRDLDWNLKSRTSGRFIYETAAFDGDCSPTFCYRITVEFTRSRIDKQDVPMSGLLDEMLARGDFKLQASFQSLRSSFGSKERKVYTLQCFLYAPPRPSPFLPGRFYRGSDPKAALDPASGALAWSTAEVFQEEPAAGASTPGWRNRLYQSAKVSKVLKDNPDLTRVMRGARDRSRAGEAPDSGEVNRLANLFGALKRVQGATSEAGMNETFARSASQ